MRKLRATTDEVLEDFRAGRITATELREWLDRNDPANATAEGED
jgi:hypothetical protein